MKFRSANWLSFFALVSSIGAIYLAVDWPRKTALFPLTIGASLLVFSAVDFILSVLSLEQTTEKERVDFELSREIEPGLRTRRTLVVFGWIIGFFFLIVFFGFMISVPLFMFLCLRFLGREPLWLSFTLGFSGWGFVYFFFDRLLHIPFPQPLITKLFGAL